MPLLVLLLPLALGSIRPLPKNSATVLHILPKTVLAPLGQGWYYVIVHSNHASLNPQSVAVARLPLVLLALGLLDQLSDPMEVRYIIEGDFLGGSDKRLAIALLEFE